MNKKMFCYWPAEAVGNETSAESADHASDGEDGYGDGEDHLLAAVGNRFVVTVRIRFLDELFYHLRNTNNRKIPKIQICLLFFKNHYSNFFLIQLNLNFYFFQLLV